MKKKSGQEATTTRAVDKRLLHRLGEVPASDLYDLDLLPQGTRHSILAALGQAQPGRDHPHSRAQLVPVSSLTARHPRRAE